MAASRSAASPKTASRPAPNSSPSPKRSATWAATSSSSKSKTSLRDNQIFLVMIQKPTLVTPWKSVLLFSVMWTQVSAAIASSLLDQAPASGTATQQQNPTTGAPEPYKIGGEVSAPILLIRLNPNGLERR